MERPRSIQGIETKLRSNNRNQKQNTGKGGRIMEEWQKRVIQEKQGLDAKIKKLTTFVNTKTNNFEDLCSRGILRQQLSAMIEYSNILNERILRFETTED
jgi:hypothetical protein